MAYIETEATKLVNIPKISIVSNTAKTITSTVSGRVTAPSFNDLANKFNSVELSVHSNNATSISVSKFGTKGNNTKTVEGNEAVFELPFGTYMVVATDGKRTVSKQIIIDQVKTYDISLSFGKVYGIRRDQKSSSPEWERTDDAVGLTAKVNTNTIQNENDFDSLYPWSEMKRCILTPKSSTYENTMVYVPEFYYKREVDNNGVETIQIASKLIDGFEKHPGSGTYVGAYECGSNATSRTANEVPRGIGLTTENGWLSKIALNGAGWTAMAAQQLSAIQMLYLVEFATNDSQTALGRGIVMNIAEPYKSGDGDDVINFNGAHYGLSESTYKDAKGNTPDSSQCVVVYRGIENIFGGLDNYIYQTLISKADGYYYVRKYPARSYKNNSYEYRPYKAPTGTNYITKMGYDSTCPWFMMPTEADGGSSSTGYCDTVSVKKDTTVQISFGGFYTGTYFGDSCGIFSYYNQVRPDQNDAIICARLAYIPDEDKNNDTTITYV